MTYIKKVSTGTSIVKISIPRNKGLVVDAVGNNVGNMKITRISTTWGTSKTSPVYRQLMAVEHACSAKYIQSDTTLEVYLQHNGTPVTLFFHNISQVIDYSVVIEIPSDALNAKE